jgi:tetratricopeptide (TPR) repeat protein
MGDRIRCLISGDLDRAAQTLPTTIQSVILTRIDHLPPEKQLTLRVAAVIGQTFSQISLYDTLREHRDIPERLFSVYLNDLTYLGLIRTKRRGASATFEFRHVIIREVSYQSLLFEWRRKLHRTVAEWYENTYSPEANQGFPAFEPGLNASFTLLNSLPPSATPLAPFYSLLVYHWHQAEDEERELHYASLIAEQAANQYANSEALGYLNRALDLVKINDLEARFKLLQMREAVFDRLGERERQSLDLMAMADIAGRLKDSPRQVVVALRQANYAEATGDYPAALNAAQQAVDLARKIDDTISESTGHILKGIVFLRQSEYQSAQERFERALANSEANNQIKAAGLLFLATNHWLQGEYSQAHEYCHQVLAICHDYGYGLVEAQCLNILGLVHYYQSEFPIAQEKFDRAITLAYTVGHRRTETKPFQNIGLIHLKLGNYEAARDYFEQAYEIEREIGDREGQAFTLSNLGIAYGTLGDYNAARSYLSHSLDIRKEIGSQAGEANTLNKFAFIYHHLGDYRSTKRYCDMAIAIQQKIGDRDGEQYSLTYLGHALAGLNDLAGAAEAYDKALCLFQDLEETSRTIDVSAGKAYVAMQQDRPDQALAVIAEILDWIDVHGIAGIDKPLWVYLTIYNILMSSSEDTPADLDRAKAVLAAACNILKEQAACIEDENLRHTFLNTVKINRDIIKFWDQMAPPPE